MVKGMKRGNEKKNGRWERVVLVIVKGYFGLYLGLIGSNNKFDGANTSMSLSLDQTTQQIFFNEKKRMLFYLVLFI